MDYKHMEFYEKNKDILESLKNSDFVKLYYDNDTNPTYIVQIYNENDKLWGKILMSDLDNSENVGYIWNLEETEHCWIIKKL